LNNYLHSGLYYSPKPEASGLVSSKYIPLIVLQNDHFMVEYHLKKCCKKYKKGKRCKKCPQNWAI